MCITIRKIALGDDVQAIYRAKKEQEYTYEKLPANKLFITCSHSVKAMNAF